MNRLPQDIIYYICEYALNESIFQIALVNIELNMHCYDSFFVEYIRYRDHPIMFNLTDNYCFKCNLKCILFVDDNFLQCSHI